MGNWLSAYSTLMFGIGNNESTYAYAADLKYNNMPDHLYKYRVFCDNHISALEKGVLYFTNTGIQDDTKESNIVISDQAIIKWTQRCYDDLKHQYGLPDETVSTHDDILKIANSFFKQHATKNKGMDFSSTPEYKEMKDEIRKFLEIQFMEMRTMYSICCFSATERSNQMWAHYADAHKGFCIEYDLKSLGKDDLLTALLFPVIYVDDNRLFVDDIDQINGNTGLLAATLKVKNEWEYQQEWRLVHKLEEDHTPQEMPKPTAIYLGEKATSKDYDYMKSYCIKTGIPLYRMKYNQRTNKIEPEKS